MQVIDADAHVVETERTWEYMETTEEAYKPAVLVPRSGKTAAPEYWLIDGRVFGKNANIGADTPPAAREAQDIEARLRHMDELEVGVHVLYPTVFLRPLTRHPKVDLALCRSYNRWLEEIWRQGKGRLRWVAVLPLMTPAAALAEMRRAKDHGACGVFMRGIEGDLKLSDPAMFPLYELATELDLPICTHSGVGNFPWFDIHTSDSGFSTFKLPAVGAFHDLIMKGIPSKFPNLRWAFIEISSQWLPYAVNDLKLRFHRQGRTFPGKDLLAANRIYVACQTTDDLDYILDAVSEEHIVIGTDYGHNDTSSEIEALRTLKTNSRIAPPVIDKILSENPARLYGL